jgi:hypothetical protein
MFTSYDKEKYDFGTLDLIEAKLAGTPKGKP